MVKAIFIPALTIGLVALFAMQARSEQRDLIETAAETGMFRTFLALLATADLRDALQSPGPYTIFAPEEDAFERLPRGTVNDLLTHPDKLKRFVSLHVVPGLLPADKLADTDRVKSLGGELEITSDWGLKVRGVRVVYADIVAANGILHVVDKVLAEPSSWPETPETEQGFERGLLKAAGDESIGNDRAEGGLIGEGAVSQ